MYIYTYRSWSYENSPFPSLPGPPRGRSLRLARWQIAADENREYWDGGDVLQHGIAGHSDLTNPWATGVPGHRWWDMTWWVANNCYTQVEATTPNPTGCGFETIKLSLEILSGIVLYWPYDAAIISWGWDSDGQFLIAGLALLVGQGGVRTAHFVAAKVE